MKSKKILSVLLSILMLFSLTPSIFAAPEMADIGFSNIEANGLSQTTNESLIVQNDNADEITVYVNLSENGEVLKDKNGQFTALSAVALSGKESYNIDDAFKAFHEIYFEEGTEGYGSDEGKYGLYVTKLWGEEYASCGYQVNRASEAVYGLSHKLKDGDVIDAVIYENDFDNLESYTAFDKYEATVFVGDTAEFCLNVGQYDENFNLELVPYKEGSTITIDGVDTNVKTDKNGKAKLKFETVGKYVISAKKTKTVDEKEATAITSPVCVVTVKDIPDAVITVPKNAELFVGIKGGTHFVSFTEVAPAITKTVGSNKEYYFELDNSKEYNYRISGDKYVTYGGIFKKTENFSLTVTKQMLSPDGKTKKTIDRLASSNQKHNVADIYLNINPAGHLKLKKDDKFQIVSLRNWEAVNSTTANYFIEPDYSFKVIDEKGKASRVVSVDENGILTAKESGTAVVLVTYDAMTLNFNGKEDFYGAIYPENTGVFVVTVDGEENDIETGITVNEGKNSKESKLSGDSLDAEHDCIYFVGEKGEYKFKPKTDGLKIYVNSPVVGDALTYKGFTELAVDDDGYCAVPLYTGRNIVKLENQKGAEYQVITAKSVSYTVNGGEAVNPGDTVSVVFDKIYHPANKLAGVYNMGAQLLYTNVSGYEGAIVGSNKATLDFACNEKAQTVSSFVKEKNQYGSVTYAADGSITVPSDYEYDTFTLSGGTIFVSGWGDPYGNHRKISYETGKEPNLNALSRTAYLGILPDIVIPVNKTSAELSGISLGAENVKTEYYAGESFDTSELTVTAEYADGTTQIATNYTVEPAVLTADTEKITVTYKGKTATLDVSVKELIVTAIEIVSPPSKTVYTEGENFRPGGMVVYASYENGTRKEIFDYSYSPNRSLKKGDSEIIVTYTGENASDLLESVSQPITVNERSGGGEVPENTKTISVYFTLLGDKKHGSPKSSDDTHTKKKNNLTVWIERTEITLEKGSYVIDAIEKALSGNGIPYECEDEYISSVKGLSEFDNGTLSGWLYSLNGKYPLKSVSQQKLSNNDEIIFHYSDDYTAEKTGFGGGGGSAGSSDKADTADKEEDNSENDAAEEKENGKTDESVTEDKTGGDDTKPNDTAAENEFSENTYGDVKSDDWFYNSVKYVHQNGLMNGTDKGFEPYMTLSRGMFALILWRADGTPSSEGVASFTDVQNDSLYADAVCWAENEKIISGISDDFFGVNENITREQFVTMLYRYTAKRGSVTEPTISLDEKFTDAENVSDYAVTAMRWAVENGIIGGTSENTISPSSPALRMEVAAMLERYFKVFTK